MIKKSLQSAIGVSIGIMIGKYVLHRAVPGNSYNDIYPANWQEIILYFVAVYTATFLVYLLGNWIKSKN